MYLYTSCVFFVTMRCSVNIHSCSSFFCDHEPPAVRQLISASSLPSAVTMVFPSNTHLKCSDYKQPMQYCVVFTKYSYVSAYRGLVLRGKHKSVDAPQSLSNGYTSQVVSIEALLFGSASEAIPHANSSI